MPPCGFYLISDASRTRVKGLVRINNVLGTTAIKNRADITSVPPFFNSPQDFIRHPWVGRKVMETISDFVTRYLLMY